MGSYRKIGERFPLFHQAFRISFFFLSLFAAWFSTFCEFLGSLILLSQRLTLGVVTTH
jgi:hypothetical protein